MEWYEGRYQIPSGSSAIRYWWIKKRGGNGKRCINHFEFEGDKVKIEARILVCFSSCFV